jgi:SulP family sulfate permease
MLSVIIAISFAALIFSGDLAGYVANGIGLALFGALAIGLVVAATSSYPGTMAGTQDSPAAILALVAAAIASSMRTSATPGAIFATVVAAIALTSLLTGAFFLVLGRFKLGNLMRFLPYPVVGGFLAGTGWLLVQGAFGVMAGASLGWSQLPYLFQPNVLALWLPGSIFAVVLLVLLRRYSHALIMPATLLVAVGLFYGLLALTHTSVAEASAQGWLLGPFPQEALWQPLTPTTLAQVDWAAIVAQLSKVGTILIVSMVALLLNASGLELTVRRDLDLNHELQSAGIANLVAGLGGGLAGYHFLGDSALAYKMGARTRLAGLFAAAVCGAALFFGASLLSFFPKPVLGGLLLFLGLSFLVEWVYDAWFKLPRMDYFLVLLILVVIGAVGYLEGVAAGVGLAVVLFVLKYSRINVVKHTLSGANLHSRVDRPLSQRQVLREKGEQLYVLQLQGFIFFGTAENLLHQIRERVKNADLPPPRFVVLDFRRVSGLDSSAVSSFVRMKQLAESKSIKLVFTHLPPEMQRQLERGGLVPSTALRAGFAGRGNGRDEVFRILPTLDQGLEWCEDQILASGGLSLDETQDTLRTFLEKVLPQSASITRLMGYLERMDVESGHHLVRQGDPADDLYFIESGAATAHFELTDGRSIRLRAMRSGTVVGEIGLYLGGARTASVVMTQPGTLYRLSAGAIQQMDEKEPEVAAALHLLIARLMAVRLAEYNDTLMAVLD